MSRKESIHVVSSSSPWAGLVEDLRAAKFSLDLVRVLQELLQLLQKATPEHAAGIFLLDEEKGTIHGQVTALFDRELTRGEGALKAAMRNTASFVISSMDGEALEAGELPGGYSQIVVPFRASPRVRGALILRSDAENAYSGADGEALSEFASQASAAIENAVIHQKMLLEGNGEVERDLVMAQEIMARLIPRTAPKIPSFEAASVNIPAKLVGGDLLDYIVLPEDHYGFLVADASGKGIPSALLMTGFRALFRGLIQNDFNIRSVFRKANQQLAESTAIHQFVSAFYASLDAATGRLIYVNGGHVAPLLYRPGDSPRRLTVGGPVLGVLPKASFHEDSVVLRPGDVLVCYSDGLSEAENREGAVFDDPQILAVVEKRQHESAEAICAALRDESARFTGYDFEDDLTICVLKFLRRSLALEAS